MMRVMMALQSDKVKRHKLMIFLNNFLSFVGLL
jgi:hypothetical protein